MSTWCCTQRRKTHSSKKYFYSVSFIIFFFPSLQNIGTSIKSKKKKLYVPSLYGTSKILIFEWFMVVDLKLSNKIKLT